MHRRWAARQSIPWIEALQARIADLQGRLTHALDPGQAMA
jgi:hypothetical protein